MNITDERLDIELRPRILQAAREVGASPALRRRVIDPAPRRTLRPLAAAVAVAVVAGAGGAVVAHQLRRAAPSHSARPMPSPKPAPTPARQAVKFPPFFARSDLALGSPVAFGHLSLTGTDNTLIIAHYALGIAGGGPASPSTAPVWRIDHSAPPGLATAGARLGINSAPTPAADGSIASAEVTYDPNLAYLVLSSSNLANPPQLDATPRDGASAAALATRFMMDRGLLVDGSSPAHAEASQSNWPDTWVVYWTRTLDGIPIEGGAGAGLTIGNGATVQSVTSTGLRVAGGSAYPLVSWRQAWTQVAAGRWYEERGGFTGGGGPSSLDTFRATAVELGYLPSDRLPSYQSSTERDDLVPMWVFSDDSGIRLFYPAVTASQLSYVHAPPPFGAPR